MALERRKMSTTDWAMFYTSVLLLAFAFIWIMRGGMVDARFCHTVARFSQTIARHAGTLGMRAEQRYLTLMSRERMGG